MEYLVRVITSNTAILDEVIHFYVNDSDLSNIYTTGSTTITNFNGDIEVRVKEQKNGNYKLVIRRLNDK